MDRGAPQQIRGRLLDIGGLPAGPAFTVSIRSVGDVYSPKVAYSPTSNSYMVIWAEPNGLVSVESYCLSNCFTYTLNRYNLYAMPLAADGAAMRAAPILLSDRVTPFNFTEAAFDIVSNSSQDEFLVNWVQPRGGFVPAGGYLYIAHPNRLVAQRLGADGNLRGGQVILRNPVIDSYKTAYSAVSNEYLTTWGLHPNYSVTFEVYFQRFAGDTLAARGSAVNLSGFASGGQFFAHMGYDPNKDRYLVTWWDGRVAPYQAKGRLVQAGTGSLVGAVAQITGAEDSASYIPYTAYSPEEGRYLVMTGTTTGGLKGRYVSDEGGALGNSFPIASGGMAGGVAARAGGDANAPRYVTVWEQNGDIFGQEFPEFIQSTAPTHSISFYVTSPDNNFMQWGDDEARWDSEANGPKDVVVVLNFGQPTSRPHPDRTQRIYGAHVFGFGYPFMSITRVEKAVQDYITGYHARAQTSQAPIHLTLAVGLNNDVNGELTTTHGQQWGGMVQRLALWVIAHPCPTLQEPNKMCHFDDHVSVVGAMDIEAWSKTEIKVNEDGTLDPNTLVPVPIIGPSLTRDWLSGYTQGTGWPLYNFGTCDCPFSGNLAQNQPVFHSQVKSYVDANGIQHYEVEWTDNDYLEFSWDVVNHHTYPLPEIYRGVDIQFPINALQWKLLSDYAATQSNGRIRFDGLMTQWLACEDQGCAYVTNKPHEGWQQLHDQIVAYQDGPKWSTDIVYADKYSYERRSIAR